LEISGVWLWRGTDKPKEITEMDSHDYHTWDKLDISKENHKNLLQEYWTGLENDSSVVQGLRARDVGYFK